MKVAARIALVLALVIGANAAVAKDPPPVALPAGARIGIVNLLSNELTHYHVGITMFSNLYAPYQVEWGIRYFVQSQLEARIKERGYAPVLVEPTAALEKEKMYLYRYFGLVSGGKGIEKVAIPELRGLAEREHLDAIALITPDISNRLERDKAMFNAKSIMLPDSISGWGVYTRKYINKTEVEVFNVTSLVLADTRNGAVTEIAGYEGQWDSSPYKEYDRRQDPVMLTPESFTSAEPIVHAMFERQINYVFDRLLPAAPETPPSAPP